MLLAEEPGQQVTAHPGVVDALLAMGLWLLQDDRISVGGASSQDVDFMAYHHLLTVSAVFHPSLNVRNAATTFAGAVLHADPDDGDRLKILEDLLENCVFASLKACAVTWLREELIAAQKGHETKSRFATTEAIERLQYDLFPSMTFLADDDTEGLAEFWAEDGAFHLQAANFGYLLFAGGAYVHLVPEGMGPAIEQRYVEPLVAAAKRLDEAIAKGDVLKGQTDAGAEMSMQLRILVDRLGSIPLQ
jgi:hypothetical protein